VPSFKGSVGEWVRGDNRRGRQGSPAATRPSKVGKHRAQVELVLKLLLQGGQAREKIAHALAEILVRGEVADLLWICC